MVQSENALHALEYKVDTLTWTIGGNYGGHGTELTIGVGTLVPTTKTNGVTTVKKLSDGNYYAILNRGLVYPGTSKSNKSLMTQPDTYNMIWFVRPLCLYVLYVYMGCGMF